MKSFFEQSLRVFVFLFWGCFRSLRNFSILFQILKTYHNFTFLRIRLHQISRIFLRLWISLEIWYLNFRLNFVRDNHFTYHWQLGWSKGTFWNDATCICEFFWEKKLIFLKVLPDRPKHLINNIISSFMNNYLLNICNNLRILARRIASLWENTRAFNDWTFISILKVFNQIYQSSILKQISARVSYTVF